MEATGCSEISVTPTGLQGYTSEGRILHSYRLDNLKYHIVFNSWLFLWKEHHSLLLYMEVVIRKKGGLIKTKCGY
jgi:hypothetical protein